MNLRRERKALRKVCKLLAGDKTAQLTRREMKEIKYMYSEGAWEAVLVANDRLTERMKRRNNV